MEASTRADCEDDSNVAADWRMNTPLWIILLLGVVIAYVNGSNDVSKGIATLVGSGITNYRHAKLWGTLWTGAGGVAAALFARAMEGTFGNKLLASGITPSLAASTATILGAAAWVAIASLTGLPVSTTHAIVGSLAAVGWVAYGEGIKWKFFGGKIALPLLLSPLISFLVTTALLRTWAFFSAKTGKSVECLCAQVETGVAPMAAMANGAVVSLPVPQTLLRWKIDSKRTCADEESDFLGLTIDHLHWITSGATAFARGLNDAPKMVALILGAAFLNTTNASIPTIAYAAISTGMVAGSWIAGRRVTTVLAKKVTRMDHREGFVANLVTAALVGPGAALGLPMSTTHVSSGAIIAVGAQNDAGLSWRTVRQMLLAWVATLPAAALLALLAYACFRWLGVR